MAAIKNQFSFARATHAGTTLRERFLTEIDRVVPWASLVMSLAAFLALPLILPTRTLHGQTTFTVNAAGTPTKINSYGMGGTNINAHDQTFSVGKTGTSCYEPNAISAKIGILRTVAYPDTRNQSRTPSYFDVNADAIVSVGASPLFIQYAYPYTSATDTNILMQSNGTVGGGTVPSNLVANVRHFLGMDGGHYAANPIETQFWEIGNEPNITVDYLMTKQDYGALFLACHQALLAQPDASGTGGTLRDHVLLCGPVTSIDYNAQSGETKSFIDWMLSNPLTSPTTSCVSAVDVITYHVYTNGASDDDQLNGQVDEEFDVTSNYYITSGTQGHSLMLNHILGTGLTFPRNHGLPYPMTAITEHGTSKMSPDSDVVNGLWNLILTHFFVKNYDTAFTTSFVYNNTDTYRSFNTNGTKPNFAYWALYFRNNLTGPAVLPYTKANVPVNSHSKDSLLFLPTLDAKNGYLYVEVINRNTTTALTAQNITINGISLGAPTTYSLTQTLLPNSGSSTLPSGTTFTATGTSAVLGNYSFPNTSAQVFQFPIANAVTTTVAPYGGGTASGSGNYLTGSPATVLAVPARGFNFVNWTVAGIPVSTSTSYTFTVTGSCSLIASFQMTFASWQAGYFSPTELANPKISGPMADPAGDGVSNLEKYAFGADPKVSDCSIEPTFAIENKVLTLTYVRNKAISDVTYTAEVSGNLAAWNSGPAYTTSPVVVIDGTTTQMVKVSDLTPVSSASQRFIRLRLSAP